MGAAHGSGLVPVQFQVEAETPPPLPGCLTDTGRVDMDPLGADEEQMDREVQRPLGAQVDVSARVGQMSPGSRTHEFISVNSGVRTANLDRLS